MKGETFVAYDDQGRKYEYVIVETQKLPDGTVVTRAKNKPIGTVKLECGHVVPVFNYDLAEELEQFYCFRCKEKKKKVEVKYKY